MLVNEEQDSKSYTEVAVVDNPLYSENEGDVAAYLEEDGKPEEEFEVEAEVIIILVQVLYRYQRSLCSGSAT